MFHYSLSTNQ